MSDTRMRGFKTGNPGLVCLPFYFLKASQYEKADTCFIAHNDVHEPPSACVRIIYFMEIYARYSLCLQSNQYRKASHYEKCCDNLRADP